VWSSSMMEKVDAVESVGDPCSIATAPASSSGAGGSRDGERAVAQGSDG
jgi:hypothetical protein